VRTTLARARRSPTAGHCHEPAHDSGAGLIGTVSGVLVFLGLMLFAVQTLMALYTRSIVTDAAHDGVRRVAGARVDHGDPAAVADARRAAEAHVRALLGGTGDRVALDWSASTSDTVALHVQVEPTSFVWAAMRGPWSALVERTVTAPVEVLR
jgi:Flp pilus assembly protein TadG